MSDVINIDKEILGGAPVFKSTRVPIAALFDYIEGGESIDDFLLDFPSVSRDQVVSLLAEIRKDTIGSAKQAA